MTSLLETIIPFFVSLMITQIIYIKADKKYNLTKKISAKLPIKQKWQASFFIFITLLIILLLGILSLDVLKVPRILFYIIVGIIGGTGNGISGNIKLNKKQK
ncbi:hypothetical protein [Clostridium sp. DL1XJH146]